MLPPHLLLTSVRLQGDHKVKETATFFFNSRKENLKMKALSSFIRIILLPVANRWPPRSQDLEFLSLHFWFESFLDLATTLNRSSTGFHSHA